MATRAGKKTAGSVDVFIAALDSPHKQIVVALRQLLLSSDPAIGEEIKWNAPSFRTSDHFATMNLRAKNGLLLILHMGAKSKRTMPREAIDDPDDLLEWLGPDRASVRLRDIDDLNHKREALLAIVRQWMQHL